MTYSKSFLPLRPSSDDDESSSTKKSPIPNSKDKVAMYAQRQLSQAQQAAASAVGGGISPIPTPHKAQMHQHGQQQTLTPVPGRLTPTGNGRIKAPPVCVAPSLKRQATGTDEFNAAGVCFTSKEADNCAEMAMNFVMGGGNNNDVCYDTHNSNMDEMPLNIEKWHDGGSSSSSWKGGQQHVSSSSTIITTSSAGTNHSTMGDEIAAANAAVAATKKEPPLKVISTSPTEDDDEHHHRLGGGESGCMAVEKVSHDHHGDTSTMSTAKAPSEPVSAHSVVPPKPSPSSSSLSTAFTNNLIKGNASRQGRSLQRWLVHSPTEELVRQVAGCIPITRDGRIVLVSASRKAEWIIPKGGWDTDETKEECAARETFEEAGLLGRLGACLEPIDYETRKSKKRKQRTSQIGSGVGGIGVGGGGEMINKGGSVLKESKEGVEEGQAKKRTADVAAIRPPLSSKRVKTDEASSAMCSIKKANSTESATPSTSLDPAQYSYVRLFLFPFYVSSVKSEWPEKGRLRKLVSIDEAIRIMEAEKRPYFVRALEMVKDQGLHLLMKNSLSKGESKL